MDAENINDMYEIIDEMKYCGLENIKKTKQLFEIVIDFPNIVDELLDSILSEINDGDRSFLSIKKTIPPDEETDYLKLLIEKLEELKQILKQNIDKIEDAGIELGLLD